MNILVTGAGGFIGSHMVDYLVGKGHKVSGVDIAYPEICRDWFEKADRLLAYDLREMSAVDEVFTEIRPDWVFHFASDMGGVGYFHAHDYYPYINNMRMDMNILSACEAHGVKQLFYSSSACVYPIHVQQSPEKPAYLSEDMIYPANSDQMYGWEKLMMLRLCERAPFDARVGIFHTIFGEGQEYEGERAKFPPTIVKKVLDSRDTGRVEIWGDGKQKRTYLYIKNAVEKIYAIMTMPYFGPVNVAGNECISVLDTAKMVADIVGVQPTYTFTGTKPSGVLGRDADTTKFNLNYGDVGNRYSMRDGFANLIAWQLKNRS